MNGFKCLMEIAIKKFCPLNDAPCNVRLFLRGSVQTCLCIRPQCSKGKVLTRRRHFFLCPASSFSASSHKYIYVRWGYFHNSFRNSISRRSDDEGGAQLAGTPPKDPKCESVQVCNASLCSSHMCFLGLLDDSIDDVAARHILSNCDLRT